VSPGIAVVGRREFVQLTGLGAGALILGLRPAGARVAAAEGQAFRFHLFLSLDASGGVEIVAHRSEMGQGIRTALPMVVADEMEADFDRVRVVQALADDRYGDQNTDGSHSVRDYFEPMRKVGATARHMLVEAAAKAWGVPPGMSMLFLGARALAAMDSAKTPRFYFDLRRYRKARDKGNFPFTPSISLLYALDVALDLLLKEGASNVHARHRRVGEAARQGAKALGLELFAEERFSSPTVTAIRLPSGIDEPALMERLRTKHRTVIARGQERLMGQIVRVGHLGFVEEPEIRSAIDTLGIALREMGVHV